ncbi:DUF2147 domain-containing protein [Sphingomonas histidinilytica]|jgi:uncharacterized protein (DUF2147 family)|nr:DUF2147 domain-containing protein [Rhizorhabdus histidinilytica]MBO9377599.1 DUF2147 domain-containing protein [Rhizorhabdus histidinilytica]QEH78655.1 DUF2147 domain-containing protein [Sphingomonas sp. C8-2]
MKPAILMTAAASLAVAAPAAASAPAPAFASRPPIEGLWMNPHGTVAVRTGDCRGRLCGWVVWASPQAIQDARDGGVDHLVGTELLEDYSTDGADRWSGSVYVPDMGRRFSSTITLPAPGELRIRGCLIGGLFCKSQTWQRIEKVPNA